MPWTKIFDPDGKDYVFIAKKYPERVESFLREAGYEVKDGLKYATSFNDPIGGETWVFPATVTVFEDLGKNN